MSKLIASVGIAAMLMLAAPPSTFAQSRGHAVPRGSVRGGAVVRGGVGVIGRPIVVAPFRGFYGFRSYAPAINFSFFYGSPGFFGAYAFGSPFWGYGYPYYYGYPANGYPAYSYPAYGYPSPYPAGYGNVVPYGYGYGGYSGQPYGGLRIDLPQRDAEVYVDGYFVGTVENFDGASQQANLSAGPHQIEIRSPEFEAIQFNVNIEAGRTITYRGAMRELPH
jgi:PEGA domain-containing protein